MKRVHTFRQSWFKDAYELCAEKGRLQLVGEMPRVENDAAAMGTAVHAAIELCLDSVMASGIPLDVGSMIEIADNEFRLIAALPNFRWIKLNENGYRAAHNRMERCITTFYTHILPKMVGTTHLELKFGPLLFHEDDDREIYLEGTIDRIPLTDFKTTDTPYEYREKDKWDVQSTFYTWAFGTLTGRLDEFHTFDYWIMFRTKEKTEELFQHVPVRRGPPHWAWLKERVIGAAKLIEADLDEWPKNDDHWLCSKKWCPAYDKCKGKHF